MKTCRICGAQLNDPLYSSTGSSITSVRSVFNAPLTLYVCQNCRHAQKPSMQCSSNYYDKEYKISLESYDFDQLYDKVDNRCIYRTHYQAELVLKFIDTPLGAKILDYGAGKASTLIKVSAIRPDLVPYVFDVSESYIGNWQKFFPSEQQATYQIPESWKSNFSLVTAHFVLEHVEDPCLFFENIAELLAPDGHIFFTVPNLLTNPGDMLAVDHINHFSTASICLALEKANLTLVKIDKSIFRGAIVCVAKRCGANDTIDHKKDVVEFSDKVNSIVRFWLKFDANLARTSRRLKGVPIAIFGAGVYGSYVALKIKDYVLLKCFLDNSPHLIDRNHMGFPVISPRDIPEDIRVIYAGLNPSIARSVLEPLRTDQILEIIYFDEGDFVND